MIDFFIYLTIACGGLVLIWHLSYYGSYYVGLWLFKLIMPRKLKYGKKLWFKIISAIPFTLGFLLDIWWNVAHFSFDLYSMNKRYGLHKTKKFWPDFSKVKGVKTLYKITLTERLQLILDTYPVYTDAYHYALEMRELLNKYDPDHLTLRKKK